MFRSICCRANLKRTSTINGQLYPSSSATTRHILFTSHNPTVVTTKASRVSSFMLSSFSYSTSNNVNSSKSRVVNYLIDSCGLSREKAITVSKILLFGTDRDFYVFDDDNKPRPDAVIKLFESYGFTKPHIAELIYKHPSILSYWCHPCEMIKAKLDFFNSKGLHGIELANIIANDPIVLRLSLKSLIIPSYDVFKSILHTDENVIRIFEKLTWIEWILNPVAVERLRVNLKLLKREDVPESIIFEYVIANPKAYMGDAAEFERIVEKVKRMGFKCDRRSLGLFLEAIEGLVSMTKATWNSEIDVYRRWGWSKGQILTAFRKCPHSMNASEKKITAIVDLLVNEMGYYSVISEFPKCLHNSLKKIMIRKCSVIRVLLSKGLIKEKISLASLSSMTDESFTSNFVKPYEQEAPELMKVFQGQLNKREILLT